MDTPSFNDPANDTRSEFEAVIERFEEAWHIQTTPPHIAEFLRVGATQLSDDHLLRELVLIDIEFRTKRGIEANVEDYHYEYPQLQNWIPEEFKSMKSLTERSHGMSVIPSSDANLSSKFGRYQILGCLGKGGMGSVYLAMDTVLNRKVALKTPQIDPKDTRRIERFYREAQLAATLRHPSICQVFDVGEVEGKHFLTMEVIEGLSLSQHIVKNELTQRDIAILIQKIAEAVAAAHHSGVVHRDLKPANIMIRSVEQPIVMDFGLAKAIGPDDAELTMSGTLVGTPAYMSPEQVDGKSESIGSSADIYSLGVILYELLTGELPFRGSLLSVLKQIGSESPRRPRQIRASIDHRLEALCLKMMSKKVGDRPASMKQVSETLSDLQLHLKKDRLRDQSTSESKPRTQSTRIRVLIATGCSLVAGIFGWAKMENWNARGLNKKSRLDSISSGTSELPKTKPPHVASLPFDEKQAKEYQETWANHLGVPLEQTNVYGMKLRLIPKGDETEPFYIGTTEVTQFQFESLYHFSPSTFKLVVSNGIPVETGDMPVESIEIYHAEKFCQFLSLTDEARRNNLVYRLPTKTEWEFACRAGSRAEFSFGDNVNEKQACFDHQDQSSAPYELWPRCVGGRAPNAFGLYDMHGNVSEYCIEPPVLKGGSWGHKADGLRVSSNYRFPMSNRNSRDGFRVAALKRDWPQAKKLLSQLDKVKEEFGIHDDKYTSRMEYPMTDEEATEFRNAYALEHGLQIEIVNSVGMKFVLIPPGSLDVDAFYLAETETTQQLYSQVLSDAPSLFSSSGEMASALVGIDTAKTPVDSVSPQYAKWFCRTLNHLPSEMEQGRFYRLPKTSEWSHACRAGKRTPFHTGASISGKQAHYRDLNLLAEDKEAGRPEFQFRYLDVASYPPNNWGLFDMHGNIAELCIGPFAAKHECYMCGGAFAHFSSNLRHSYAADTNPDKSLNGLGFRVAMDLKSKDYNDRFDAYDELDELVDRWPEKKLQELETKLDSLSIEPTSEAEATAMRTGWAELLNVPEVIVEPNGVTLLLIPGTATLDPYYISKTEITQSQFGKQMGRRPSAFSSLGSEAYSMTGIDTESHPVDSVTLEDCFAFCRSLSESSKAVARPVAYRVPTCQEWRYACMGGLKSRFHFGDLVLGENANFNSAVPSDLVGPNSRQTYFGRTSRTGTYAANLFGLFDMHGNVAEFCTTPTCTLGGSMLSAAEGLLATNSVSTLQTSSKENGFRICLDVKPGSLDVLTRNQIDRVRARRSQRRELKDRHPEILMMGTLPEQAIAIQSDWANWYPQSDRENSIGMKFCCIPAGVDTAAFFIGAHEVTQSQFKTIMGFNPSHFCESGMGAELVNGLETSDFPVESVSMEYAQTFCRRLSQLPAERSKGCLYRIPTTAEWKFAAQCGLNAPFHTGEKIRMDQANLQGSLLRRTVAVGSYPPNLFGLFDMHGNVREFCEFPVNLRGGSWELITPYARTGYGGPYSERFINPSTGFRVVLFKRPDKM